MRCHCSPIQLEMEECNCDNDLRDEILEDLIQTHEQSWIAIKAHKRAKTRLDQSDDDYQFVEDSLERCADRDYPNSLSKERDYNPHLDPRYVKTKITPRQKMNLNTALRLMMKHIARVNS